MKAYEVRYIHTNIGMVMIRTENVISAAKAQSIVHDAGLTFIAPARLIDTLGWQVVTIYDEAPIREEMAS